MSYFVLALGGLLALGGAVVLATSYGIIMVERGWAGVIAGTTALASGVVTIALGLVLHRLTDFYTLLAGKAPRHLSKATAPEAGPDSAGHQPASGLRSWPQRAARSFHSPGRNIHKSRAALTSAPARLRESQPSLLDPNESRAEISSEANSGSAASAEMAEGRLGQDMPAFPAPLEQTFAETGANEASGELELRQDNAGDEALPAGSFAKVPVAATDGDQQAWPEGSEPNAPAVAEAIIPQAEHLARLTIPDSPKQVAESLLELREAANLEPPAAIFETGAEDHLMGPGSGLGPPSSEAAGGETLAIVGRYESEGASFVRYADGSIEARTDRAVFHFKSMAELKSFMESQARTPKG
jgi:hypothetical protein